MVYACTANTAAHETPPFSHVNITGETYTADQCADVLEARPAAEMALRAALERPIFCPDPEDPWFIADIRVLRLHRLLNTDGYRVDKARRLRINDAGKAALAALDLRRI